MRLFVLVAFRLCKIILDVYFDNISEKITDEKQRREVILKMVLR